MRLFKDLLLAGSFLSLAVCSSALPGGEAPELRFRQTDALALINCLHKTNVPFSIPSEPNWTGLATAYNLRLQYVPAAITLPETVQHVSDSVTCAAASNVKVQPKSGGHSYASHSSGGKNGSLVVDLQNFNSIEVDGSTFIATVGTGVRLGNLALALWAQGERAVPHGDYAGVGIGGQFTHGGFGYASRRWGLALDTIVALDVVLANGTFVHATPASYPDIYFAMRGAADAFGIATAFYLQTLPAPENVVNFKVDIPVSKKTVTEVASGFVKLQKVVLNGLHGFDRNTSFGFYTSGTSAMMTGWYFGSSYSTFKDVTLEAILAGFPASSSRTFQNLSWIHALDGDGSVNLTQPLTGYHGHDTFYAKSIVTRTAEPISESAWVSFWTYCVNNRQAISSIGNWYSIINLYGGYDSQINVPASGSSAYGDRNSLWVFQNYGSSLSNQWHPDIEVFIDDLTAALVTAQPDGNFSAYLNYVDPEYTAAQAAQLYYGQELYDKLVSIKQVVDPQDIFWNPQSIGNADLGGTGLPENSDGSCGAEAGKTCNGNAFGSCCSSYGYCGNGSAYCEAANGCQSAWGTCGMTSSTSSLSTPMPTHVLPTPSPTPTPGPLPVIVVSADGKCGPLSGTTCAGSGFGECCSSYDYCGTGDLWCSLPGCQKDYGSCSGPAKSGVSIDGICGAGTTCSGSEFGLCCSSYNSCGTGDLWCGTGCQEAWGECNSTSSTPLVNQPQTTSTDGTCGLLAPGNHTCTGSTFGDCCSVASHCGGSDEYCSLAVGCQAAFGLCI